MVYLKDFESVNDANTQGASGLYSPHVSIVEGKDIVNYASVNTETFTCTFNDNGTIQNVTPVSQGHNLGDIAYWDGSKVAFTPYTSWTASLGTALGVCFIPTSHASVWGDGKARFLSVKGVNADGTAADTEQTMKWGGYGTDLPLTNYTQVPTWDNTIGGSVGNNSTGYISSDKLTGATNTIDTLTKYYSSPQSSMIPSPYAADGSFYADYIRTILSGETNVNALSDFNGKSNTGVIINALTGNSAAKACSLYSTSGIAAGEWYLPACGELAYIMPRFNVINSALTACGGVSLVGDDVYWSSSESSSNNAYYVNAYRGNVCSSPKGTYFYVRPVAALS